MHSIDSVVSSLGCWIWLRLQINSQFNHIPYPLVPELTKLVHYNHYIVLRCFLAIRLLV